MKDLIIQIIISVSNVFCNYSLTDIKADYNLFKKRVKRYLIIKKCPKMKFEWFWRDNIKQLKETKDKDLLCILFKNGNDDVKFIITKLLYFADLYDEENCEMVLNFTKETNSKYRYWTTMDISRFTFLLQKGFYPNYYLDRKDLIKQIAEEMGLNIPKKCTNDNSNKLCIITHLLADSLSNSAQRVATMIAKGLLDKFDEIMVVTLDIFTPANKEKNELTTVLPYPASKLSEEAIRNIFPEKVIVHYPQGDNYIDKSQDSLNAIYDFNPRVIVDMSDEYSALSYYYSKDYYTFYQPLRNDASSSFFSSYGGKPWKVQEVNKKYHSISINQVLDWSFPEYVPPQRNKFTKNDMGIDRNSFVLVSIGNNEHCCDDKFVDTLCNLLKKNNNFVLVFVGQGAPAYLKKHYSALLAKHQIIEWGYEKNLYGLCSACDVLIRPDMTGGSGATAIAAMSGLPIAMTKYICDPSRWLGIDFSSNEDYEQMMCYIQRLYDNRDFYNSEAAKCKKLIDREVNSDDKWNYLANEMKMESNKKYGY